MKKIKTKKFIFSTQAKKLPEVIPIDEEFAYILGLWNADRCSTAKGIVGLRSKDDSLLEAFRKFFKKLGLQPKERTVIGYGKTKEVYVCSMPLRRIFEWARKNRLKLFGKRELILAYVAGLFDGDGSSGDKSHLVIFYGKNEMDDVKKDKELIWRLGFRVSIKEKENHIRLYILKPKRLINMILPYVKLKRKFNKAA